jgi:hypothetical protein
VYDEERLVIAVLDVCRRPLARELASTMGSAMPTDNLTWKLRRMFAKDQLPEYNDARNDTVQCQETEICRSE